MQDILVEYNKAVKNDDLFKQWDEELTLRNNIRNQNIISSDIKLNDLAEINFIFRSLYFKKTIFFQILFNNMTVMTVLNWIVNSPEKIFSEFLDFLPWYIINTDIKPKQLQFLVNIYNQEYYQQFSTIVNVLDINTCRFLVNRTASTQLRDLLKKREDYLLEKEKASYYGIIDRSDSSLTFPTIYGDKVDLLTEAVGLFKRSWPTNFTDPYSVKRFNILLQFSERLFRGGLIEDCLAILVDLCEDYQQKSRLVEILDDELIYKQFNKLLRSVIPIYSILTNPLQAYAVTLNIYDKYFPRFNPEPASLLYLYIYESIVSGLIENSKYISYEILYKSREIQIYRPSEVLLLQEQETVDGLDENRVKMLYNTFRQKIFSLPHEAFVTMELIRLFQLRGLIQFNKELAEKLIDGYLQLWKWIPGKRFINQSLLEQLGPFSNDYNRYELEKTINLIQYYSYEKLISDLNNRPDLFRKKDENTRREIFTGKFMGVL
jgi:hypothetical protein